MSCSKSRHALTYTCVRLCLAEPDERGRVADALSRRYRDGSGPSRPVSPTHSWTQNRKRQGTKSREEQESLARQQVADSYSQQSREEIRSGPTSSELLQRVPDSPNRAAMYLGGRRIETTGPYKARPRRSVTPLDKRKSASYPAHYMKGKEGGRRKYS